MMFYTEAGGPRTILGIYMLLCAVFIGMNITEIYFLLQVVWAKRGSLESTQIPWVSNLSPALQAYSYQYESIAYWIWFICFFKPVIQVYALGVLGQSCKRPWIYPIEIVTIGFYVVLSIGISIALIPIYNKCEVGMNSLLIVFLGKF